jgi:hypothetical protein
MAMKMPTDSTAHLVLAVFVVLFLPRWATVESLLMAYADKPPIRFLTKVSELMPDETLTLATADGFSCGQEIDSMITAFPGRD